jgi:hypothetical protein
MSVWSFFACTSGEIEAWRHALERRKINTMGDLVKLSASEAFLIETPRFGALSVAGRDRVLSTMSNCHLAFKPEVK